MPLDGLINSSTGGSHREDSSASKSLPEIKSTFSETSYQLGVWGDDLAKNLHESRYLYATYGALDGLSNICSHWRWLFDLLYATSSNSDDKLHEFLSSPEGMALVGIETLAIMAYATIGNYFDSDDKDKPILSLLALTWPYLRDCFKGSKNAYKGVRAALNIASLLSGTSLFSYVVPTSLGVGALAIVNRLLLRYMYTQRKYMMKNNKIVWLDIQALDAKTLTPDEMEQQGKEVLSHVQEQSKTVRALAFIGAAFGGLVDGLYMYVGIVTLLTVPGLIWLTAPVALFLIGCSVLYGLTNIAVRMYEEYDYQRKLDITVAKANLALTGKKIECLYHTLRLDKEEMLSQKHFKQLTDYVDTFVRQREELRDLSVLSYKSAFLLGVTHGLAAYGALASFVFAASTITFLIMGTIPPFLLIAVAITIASGIFLIAGFAINALYQTYKHHQKLSEFEQLKTAISLKELKELVKLEKGEVYANKPDDYLEEKIHDCMVIDNQPLFFYMELFEVVRSFFSGVGKGPKSVMTTFNAFQEKGDDGEYHFDSWILLAFTSVSSVVYATCLALRAYARGFGRPPVDYVEMKGADGQEPSSKSSSPKIPMSQNDKSQKRRSSDFSLFAKKSVDDTKFSRSHSDSELLNQKENSSSLAMP
ncbi:hypothetical protein [Legionella sp. W05-934-2]|uniref:hypothetical protein n=1 Tax=Legionella sp. W05-934-2 TaxID=1198649 RepID=UPI00346371BA